LLSDGTGHTLLYIVRRTQDLEGDRPVAATSPQAASARHVVAAADRTDGSWIDTAIADPEGRIAHRYGIGDHGEIFAIRPDGYIGMRARIDDPGRLHDYFAALYRDSALPGEMSEKVRTGTRDSPAERGEELSSASRLPYYS
jgi:hypothetical protein